MPVCCLCHVDKPEHDFAFRSLTTGVRQGHCRTCHAAYRRRHYLQNRAAYVAREMARMNAYRVDNRLRLFEYLSAHPCVSCGEADVLVLEFDHRDPSQKRAAVTHIAARKPWKFVLKEIALCDVRCANCHRRRTASQFNWARGTAAVVSSPVEREPRPPLVSVAGPAGSKTCTACGETKPATAFSVKNKDKGRRATHCTTCVAANSRAHYARNRETYLLRARQAKRRYRGRNRSGVADYLAGRNCVDCGVADIVVLEFDHRDGADKEDDVAGLMAAGRWSKVEAEIAKCDVRCANCHRRRTAAQFGWTKRSLQATAATITGTRV